MASFLPPHLRKYVVEQNYEKYTPVDQAVWRFILRQLRAFLSRHAHESYLDGLEKTGIEVERIPRIADISEKISRFGWRALPVSGFIPPAAFMELQSLGVLPIASDLRTLDHLLYTPAPDIVHEAAGHAPILVDPEYAQYLKEYAQVARKAIMSREDLNLYEAIRHLSDIKEHPDSSIEEIGAAQAHLDRVTAASKSVSEAGELSRMNWWTAEYGLIGSLQNPKIFGAGLLSSVGESRWCLSEKVKKLPLTVDCIKQSYDITEPQPQLFVTPDFKALSRVLEQMAERMAFRTGGFEGLQKALISRTLNTVQWDSGLQVGGELVEVLDSPPGHLAYLRFQGPCQLAYQEKELAGHDKTYHAHGFGSPVGKIKGQKKNLADWSLQELKDFGFNSGSKIRFEFESGVTVEGVFKGAMTKDSKNLLLAFTDCKVTLESRVLFEPSWGTYDMAVGATIPSVFGGVPDRAVYGEVDDFVAMKVPARKYSPIEILQHEQYQKLRDLRESKVSGSDMSEKLSLLLKTHDEKFSEDWLFRIEALELVLNRQGDGDLEKRLRQDLAKLQSKRSGDRDIINDGIALAHQI